jgi:hypothetical protein
MQVGYCSERNSLPEIHRQVCQSVRGGAQGSRFRTVNPASACITKQGIVRDGPTGPSGPTGQAGFLGSTRPPVIPVPTGPNGRYWRCLLVPLVNTRYRADRCNAGTISLGV